MSNKMRRSDLLKLQKGPRTKRGPISLVLRLDRAGVLAGAVQMQAVEHQRNVRFCVTAGMCVVHGVIERDHFEGDDLAFLRHSRDPAHDVVELGLGEVVLDREELHRLVEETGREVDWLARKRDQILLTEYEAHLLGNLFGGGADKGAAIDHAGRQLAEHASCGEARLLGQHRVPLVVHDKDDQHANGIAPKLDHLVEWFALRTHFHAHEQHIFRRWLATEIDGVESDPFDAGVRPDRGRPVTIDARDHRESGVLDRNMLGFAKLEHHHSDGFLLWFYFLVGQSVGVEPACIYYIIYE